MPSTVHHSVACPACGLLCDDLEVIVERDAVRVSGRGCAKSERFFSAPFGALPTAVRVAETITASCM